MGYERIAIFLPTDVLPFIGAVGKQFAGKLVNMHSQRYKVFNVSLACSTEGCPLVGSLFGLERSEWGKRKGPIQHNRPYHFNLYAVRADGTEVLMTKDHVVPKARGGTDTLGNYVTMCSPCNSRKGDKLPSEIVQGNNGSKRTFVAKATNTLDDIAMMLKKLDILKASKNKAYTERNHLVAAFSKLFPSWLETHPAEETWPEQWRTTVFIEGPTGQMCWHIHDSEVGLFAHLEHRISHSWDKHTTEEKYQRLASLPTLR